MRLVKARIKNFRAISDLEVDLGQHAVFLGANGVGKSCILKAIDRFFAKSTNVSVEDFHEKNTADPIEISLTFKDFSDEELEVFGSKIHNDEMSVVRVFIVGATSRDNGKYFGLSLRNEALQEVRAIEGAVPRRAAFNALVGTPGFEDLLTAANAPQVTEHMELWEAQHVEQCVLAKDDGQFFGFTNVARGALNKYISFVFVPAVRDAASDALDSRGSVINQLIELLVKSVIQKRADILAWQAEASAAYKELVSPENLGELGELEGMLSSTLEVFYHDAGVKLGWRSPEDFLVNLPVADVSLIEQGYAGPVENKGHGLQRALIFTLLQHLAKALSSSSVVEDAQQEVENEDGDAPDNAVQATSHSVILAIEEPELYQHPIKQRHIAKVLQQISGGHIDGVMSQTQVLICSHSPHFISTERFDDVRLTRRERTVIDDPPCCVVRRVSYEQVIGVLNEAYGTDDAHGFKNDSLKARLHTLDEAVNEGFFANAVVLVEGVGDRAALIAVSTAQGINLASKGIAIVSVDGKTNIDRPLAIFSLLGIPTYAIFDCDNDKTPAEQKIPQNIAIQRISGETDPVEIRSFVGQKFASFETNLNVTMEAELGAEYANQVGLAGYKYGLDAKRVIKNPVSYSNVVTGCLAAGGTCVTLNQVIASIVALVED